MTAALGRFFNYVVVAIALIWVSGFALLAPVGLKNAPPGWQIMIYAAAAMTVLFAVIRLWLFPRAQRAVAAAELSIAGAALNQIRWLVLINLVLGFIAVAGVSIFLY